MGRQGKRPVTTRTDNTPPATETVGIFYAIAATATLTTQDGVTKWLGQHFSVGEILLYRGLLTLPFCFAILIGSGGLHLMRPKKPLLNSIRAGFALFSSMMVVASFSFMPLADALGVIFISPLLTLAFAIPLLGERVSPRIWYAVAAGLLGALLIIQPGGRGLDWHLIVPLAAAVGAAMRDIVTRALGSAEHQATTLFWTMLALTLGGLCWAGWTGMHWPSAFEWLIFLVCAVMHTAAYYFAIQSLRLARASTVAPYKYLSLVWAAVIGFVWWGDFPNGLALAGGLLVVGAGLFVLRTEIRGRTR